MMKSEYEITKLTETSLSATSSFMFQQTQEEELLMGFGSRGHSRVVEAIPHAV
jgi:hypothetical protein